MGMLQDKVAIITGAGRGIGRGLALMMASEGAKVVVNDPGVGPDGVGTDDGPADQVVAEIKAAGGTAVANHDSVATSARRRGHHQDRARHLRSHRHPGQQRRHPARPHGVQHDGGGLGRRDRGAPEGALQRDPAGLGPHAPAALRPDHQLQLGVRPLGQRRPGRTTALRSPASPASRASSRATSGATA